MKSPAKMLKLWDVVDGCIVSTHGALWGAAEVFGIDPTDKTLEAWQNAAKRLYASFPKLADNTFMQFVWEHREAPHAALRTEWGDSDAPIFAYQRKKRFEYLRAKKLSQRRLYLFYSARQALTRQEFRQVSVASHREALAELGTCEATLRTILRRGGMELRGLDEEEIFTLFARWMAPEDVPRAMQERRQSSLSPREQLFRGEVLREPRHVQLGGSYVRVLACKELPPSTTVNCVGRLDSQMFPFRLVVNLWVPNRQLAEGGFRQQRRLAAGWAGQLHGPKDTAAEVGIEEMDQLDYELVRGSRLMKVGIQAVVWGSTPKQVDMRATALRDALRNIDVECFEETGCHDREFFKTLPGMAGDFDRWRLVTSSVAADLIPSGNYSAGDRSPQITLQNAMSGEPFGYSLREPVRSNDNWMVLGASGAGKSTWINMLLSNVMLAGPQAGRVIGIDYAGPTKSSFRTACDVFGGKYIGIAGDGQKINPWKPKSEACSGGIVRPEILSMLTRISNLLLYNEGDSKEDAIYESLIQQGIRDVYAHHEGDWAPRYQDLLDAFRQMRGQKGVSDKMLERLIGLLQKMLSGPEAALLNEPTRIDTDGQLVVYDLFGLHAYDTRIRAAVAATVMYHVRAMAFDGRPDKKKYLAFEEVTNLLSIGLKETISEIVTTCRAHSVSAGLITQEYGQYRRSGLAETINLNTTTKFLMSHANALNAMEPVIEDMQLNEREAELFRGLQAVKGEYSEMLVKTKCWSPEGGRDVTAKLRFELSPFDMQLVTSAPEDRARQMALQQQYPDATRVEILKYLAYGRHRGQIGVQVLR